MIKVLLAVGLLSHVLFGLANDESLSLSNTGVDYDEIISINKSVTDEEVENIIRDYFTFSPEDTAIFNAQNEEERIHVIQNFRMFSDEIGMNLAYLRDETVDFKESYSEFAHKVTSGKERAETILKNMSDQGFRQMIDGAKYLIDKRESFEKHRHSEDGFTTEVFSWHFDFVEPDLAHIHDRFVHLVIHKGVGTEIGYDIKHITDDEWQISTFNLYEDNHDKQVIVIYEGLSRLDK